MDAPKLNGIDHLHLYVSDKQKAAKWYRDILGFEVIAELECWNDDYGPLTIGDESGIHLALFTKSDQQPLTSLAFNTNGEGFLQWEKYLEQQGLMVRIADHKVSWSLYFRDPDENYHEITSYEYDWISSRRFKK